MGMGQDGLGGYAKEHLCVGIVNIKSFLGEGCVRQSSLAPHLEKLPFGTHPLGETRKEFRAGPGTPAPRVVAAVATYASRSSVIRPPGGGRWVRKGGNCDGRGQRKGWRHHVPSYRGR